MVATFIWMTQKHSQMAPRALTHWNAGRILALLGVSAGAIGSLMPWVQLETLFISISVSGTNGDGKITLVLFLLAALVLLLGHRPTHATVAMLLCTLAGAVCLYDLTNISGYVSRSGIREVSELITAGSGLYVSIGGAVLGLIGSYVWPKN